MVAGGDDQFAAAQGCKRDLDGAFGKASRVGKCSYARDDRFPFLPSGLAVEIQINQIRSWLLIVPDEIAHQDVENIVVDGNGFAKSGHNTSIQRGRRYTDNKQAFLTGSTNRQWTGTWRQYSSALRPSAFLLQMSTMHGGSLQPEDFRVGDCV
jgi:hypothetical protein